MAILDSHIICECAKQTSRLVYSCPDSATHVQALTGELRCHLVLLEQCGCAALQLWHTTFHVNAFEYYI